jgi:hypothetical protein
MQARDVLALNFRILLVFFFTGVSEARFGFSLDNAKSILLPVSISTRTTLILSRSRQLMLFCGTLAQDQMFILQSNRRPGPAQAMREGLQHTHHPERHCKIPKAVTPVMSSKEPLMMRSFMYGNTSAVR